MQLIYKEGWHKNWQVSTVLHEIIYAVDYGDRLALLKQGQIDQIW